MAAGPETAAARFCNHGSQNVTTEFDKADQQAPLRAAAQAVIDRWDSPNWKFVEPTGAAINRLRSALASLAPSPTPPAPTEQAADSYAGSPHPEFDSGFDRGWNGAMLQVQKEAQGAEQADREDAAPWTFETAFEAGREAQRSMVKDNDWSPKPSVSELAELARDAERYRLLRIALDMGDESLDELVDAARASQAQQPGEQA